MANYNDEYFIIKKKLFNLRLSPAELSVLSVLFSFDYNDKHPGEVYPSKDTIREHITIGKAKLDDTLEILQCAGLVSMEKRAAKNCRFSQKYTLIKMSDLDEDYQDLIKDRLTRVRAEIKSRRKRITPPESDLITPRRGDLITPPVSEESPRGGPSNHPACGQESPRGGAGILINNINNLKLISENGASEKNDPNDFITEIEAFGKTYKFYKNHRIWDGDKNINIAALVTECPDHPVSVKAKEIYEFNNVM